jgi:hypothetical protein
VDTAKAGIPSRSDSAAHALTALYPLWASAAGNAVIGYLDTRARTASGQKIPGVTRFGVFSAGAFRSLPYPPLSGGVSLPEHIAW